MASRSSTRHRDRATACSRFRLSRRPPNAASTAPERSTSTQKSSYGRRSPSFVEDLIGSRWLQERVRLHALGSGASRGIATPPKECTSRCAAASVARSDTCSSDNESRTQPPTDYLKLRSISASRFECVRTPASSHALPRGLGRPRAGAHGSHGVLLPSVVPAKLSARSRSAVAKLLARSFATSRRRWHSSCRRRS